MKNAVTVMMIESSQTDLNHEAERLLKNAGIAIKDRVPWNPGLARRFSLPAIQTSFGFRAHGVPAISEFAEKQISQTNRKK